MGLRKCCNCNGFQYPAVTVCMYENRAESIERFTQVTTLKIRFGSYIVGE